MNLLFSGMSFAKSQSPTVVTSGSKENTGSSRELPPESSDRKDSASLKRPRSLTSLDADTCRFSKRVALERLEHDTDSTDTNSESDEDDDVNVMTDLERAAAEGNVRRIRELIQEGADVNQQDDMGDTALHLASREGNKSVVRGLLDVRGVDMNLRNYDTPGETAREIALRNGHVDIAKLLEKRQGIITPPTMRSGPGTPSGASLLG